MSRADRTPSLSRLAIIDDDRTFTRGIAAQAAAVGVETIEPITDRTPPFGLKAAKLDAILIDPTAVGAGFWAYLEQVCGELSDVSVLVCAAPSGLASRVRGLRLGADDWITKPASAREVLARVEASRRPRRTRAAAEEEPVLVGELEIRLPEVDVRAGGRPVALTLREFELLHFLAGEDGRVLERETIYRRVWGYAMAPGDRSVDTFVRKLRSKLGAASPHWTYIHTHFGIGYRFEPRQVAPPLAGVDSRPSLPSALKCPELDSNQRPIP